MAEAVVTEGNDGLDGPVAASNGPSGRAVDIDGAVWQLAQALAGAVTPEDVALAVAEHGAPAAAAAFTNVALSDLMTGRIRAVHGPSLDPLIADRWSEFALSGDTPLGDAILSGTPILLDSLEAIGRRYPRLLADTVGADLSATASFPLRRAGGETLGAVGFAWLEPQALDPAQCLGLSLIADLTAQALDRALLYDEVVETASRIRFLQRLTEHFASATSAVEIAEIAVAEVAPLVGASIVNITRVVDGDWIEHVADTELPEWLGRTTRRPFSDRVPSTDAARTGKPVVFHTHADREAAYEGASWLGELADFGPVVALPAVVSGHAVGTLALVFPAGIVLTSEDLDFLGTVCDQVGQALERVRLLEEHDAHARDLRKNLDRIQALQRVTSKLATATTTESICRAIVDEGITMIGDYGGVCVADPDDDNRVLGWFTPGFSPELDDEFSLPIETPMGLITAFREDRLVIARSLEESIALSPTNSAAHRQHQSQGILGVPAHANGEAVGSIGMGFTSPGAVTDEVVAISSTFADLLGQALYRASLYERSHQVAQSLQASLLPQLPEVDGYELAARYAPGGAVGGDGEVLVGGDWYEVIEHGSGRLSLVIGDVMGRGIEAAAVMGQLRALARGCAHLNLPPGRTMEILDGLLATVAEDKYATCLFGVYDSGAGTFTFASAGHPMPLLIIPDTPPVSLAGPVGPPLGAGLRRYTDQAVEVASSGLLALFTDGLIESRTLDVSDGVRHLADCLAIGRDLPISELADKALGRMATLRAPDDDTALLLVRVP